MNFKYIALKIPGSEGQPGMEIKPPEGIPHGADYTIGSLASKFIEVAMIIGIVISIFYFLYGGVYWMQSKGDKEKLDHARRILVYSIMGLIIMALSLVVVNVFASALGVKTTFTLR